MLHFWCSSFYLFDKVVQTIVFIYAAFVKVTDGTLIGRHSLSTRYGNLCYTSNHANGFLEVTEHADVFEIYG